MRIKYHRVYTTLMSFNASLWKLIMKTYNVISAVTDMMDLDIFNFWCGIIRSNGPEVFLRKALLKTCSKFTGAHPGRNVISMKLLCDFIEIILRDGCSSVILLDSFRIPSRKNTSGRTLLSPGNMYTLSNTLLL